MCQRGLKVSFGLAKDFEPQRYKCSEAKNLLIGAKL